MRPVPLRFTVLGEVRIWRDGAEVDPGPPLRRTLLALLLARAGSPVQLPDIVDWLWGERAPTRAVNMVHRHVGALRRLLEPELPPRAEGGLLLRGGGGYRLVVPADSVDLLRFRLLARRARDVLGRSGPESAVDVFAEALALREGPAAGCPAQAPAHPVFVELDREYDAVVREAAGVALECGRADRVLPALSASAERHPLDEGMQALLVSSLAATGRRDRALAVFRTTAGRLADELGVDPGPELTTARLRAEGEDPARTEPPVTPPAFTPAQLPSSLPAFAGREAELHRLRALLDGADGIRAGSGDTTAPLVCAIGGTAGVGKTALALRLAHEVADRFPDGQLYVNLRGFDPAATPTPARHAVRAFLDALGVPAARVPDSPDAQTALYRSLLAGRRMLVLLDNARDAAQVRPLLPGTAGCLVLVTSRNRLTGLASADGAHPFTLDVLTPDDARAVLALRIGAERAAAEPEAVAEIVSLTARLPLALAIVAARAVAHPAFPLATLAEELRGTSRGPDGSRGLEGPGALDGFRHSGSDTATDVRAVFSWSYDALGPGAARLFRLLALHPGPDLTVPAAAALADLPVGRTRPLLGELADAHLLTERTPGRYAVHDLLHAYAAELLHTTDSTAQRRAARRRLLDHCLHTAYAAALLFDAPTALITPVAPAQPLPETRPAALDAAGAQLWFRTERPVLLGAFRQAVDSGLDAHVWQLAWCLERFHERFGHWHEYLAVQRAALPAAHRLRDPVALGHARRALGRACMMLRRFAEAEEHLRYARGWFEEAADGNGEAEVRLARWAVLTRQERFGEALDELAPALDLYRASAQRKGQAYVLVSRAWGEACTGDCHGALTHAHQALALFQELGVRIAEGYTWDTLGHVHGRLGEHRRSVTCHERALAVFREVGDLFNEAGVLDRLGDARLAAGDRAGALATWRDARDAMQDFDPVWAAEVRAKTERHAQTP
ncbi:BTAD domain-containing putative transcriptional regulator [Streptomyces sp. NPDC002588]|uniref:AfsR/SARP family transcriptional regulator n=1 Tax=Streptomyces sp. NPDC002588 TaxID=3154419 RepID=UPI00332F5191